MGYKKYLFIIKSQFSVLKPSDEIPDDNNNNKNFYDSWPITTDDSITAVKNTTNNKNFYGSWPTTTDNNNNITSVKNNNSNNDNSSRDVKKDDNKNIDKNTKSSNWLTQ